MTRTWYVEFVRMFVVIVNLLLLGSLVSTGFEQYQNLDGRDPKFWRKLFILGLLFFYFVLVVILGLWGSLVHSLAGVQSALVLLIVGAVLLVLMHFYGILSWDINLKKLIFVTAVAVVLCISYFILVNFSKTEVQLET